MPPEYLIALLQNIEQVVTDLHKEFPQLKDADVEWAYEQLLKFYKTKASGKAVEEPESSLQRRQDLMDEILNIIDARESINADTIYIKNSDFRHGEHTIRSLEVLYILGFKQLKDSARFWRKENGPKGYLRYIAKFMQ